jgi:hypothetical protein
MITSVQALAAAAQKVPAYCATNHISTPAQWKACWNAGYHLPATGAANAGSFAGHNVAPWALIAGIIIGLLWLASRSGSRRAATSNESGNPARHPNHRRAPQTAPQTGAGS